MKTISRTLLGAVILLTVSLCLSPIVQASEEPDAWYEYYWYETDENHQLIIKGSNGRFSSEGISEVTIPATTEIDGEIYDTVIDNSENYESFSPKYCLWKEDYQAITKITFEDGVALASNVGGLFMNMTNLQEVDLSGVDSSCATDFTYMFLACNSLTSVDLSSLDTTHVTDMDAMFYYCTDLQNITFGDHFDTSEVTDMNNMFSYCTSLEALLLGNFDTSKVTNMSGMFEACYSLMELDVSSFNTEHVENMYHMFAGIGSYVHTLDVRHFTFKDYSVETEGMFDGQGITDLYLPVYVAGECDLRPDKHIAHIYYDGGVDDWDALHIQTNPYVDIYYENTEDPAALSSPGDGGVADDWYKDYEYYLNKTTKRLILKSSLGNLEGDIMIPGKTLIDDVTYITVLDNAGNCTGAAPTQSLWHADRDKITGISFDEGVELSPICGGLFVNLNALESLDLSNLDTSRAIDLSFLFHGCSSLTSLNLNMLNTDRVKFMQVMFKDCTGLQEIKLDGTFSTQEVWDMNSMFYQCAAVETLNLGNFNTEKVTSMHMMFYGCANLMELNISSFNTSKVTDMYKMFEGLSPYIHELDLSGFEWGESVNCQEMFNGAKFTDLYLPENVLRDFVYFDRIKHLAHIYCAGENPGGYYSVPRPVDVFYSHAGGAPVLPAPGAGGVTTDWYKDYDYFLNNTTHRLILKSSLGNFAMRSETDITIPAQTVINGSTYITVLDNAGNCTGAAPTQSLWHADREVLKSISIEEGVELSQVSAGLFMNLNNLETLDLKGLDSSRAVDLSFLFHGCSALKSLNVSGLDTAKVKYMQSMFANCSDLKNITFQGDSAVFVTTDVYDMNSMFSHCASLEALLLGQFNTRKVSNMLSMFDGCTSLMELDISSFSTSNVKNFSRMFAGLSPYIHELDLRHFLRTDHPTQLPKPEVDTSGIFSGAGFTDLYLAYSFTPNNDFSYNTATPYLAHIYYDGIDESVWNAATGNKHPAVSPIDLYYAQEEGPALLPDPGDGGVTTDWYKDYEYYLNKTTKRLILKSSLGKFTERSEQSITIHARTSIDGVTYRTVLDNAGNYRNMAPEKSLWYADRNVLKNIVFENGVELSPLSGGLFMDLNNLETLDLTGLDSSRAVDFSFLFRGCSALKSLNVSVIDTAKVKYMQSMFANCSELKSIIFKDSSAVFDTSDVYNMNNMFYQCSALESLLLDNFNTAKVRDMSYMFYGCASLMQLDISSFNTQNVTTMQFMFEGLSPYIHELDLRHFDFSKCSSSSYTSTPFTHMFYRTIGINDLYLPASSVYRYDFAQIGPYMLSHIYYGGNEEGWRSKSNNTSAPYAASSYAHGKINLITGHTEGPATLPVPEGEAVTTDWYKDYDYYLNKDTKRLILKSSLGHFADKEMSVIRIPAKTVIGGETYVTVLDNAGNANMYSSLSGFKSLWDADKDVITALSFDNGVELAPNSMVLFAGLNKLKTLDLTGLNSSRVLSISGFVSNCSALQDLTLGDHDFSQVYDMSYMFSGCASLRQLDLSNFDTQDVVDMTGMFNDLSANVLSLDLRHFDFSAFKDYYYGKYPTNRANYMFKGAGISELYLPARTVYGHTFNRQDMPNLNQIYYGGTYYAWNSDLWNVSGSDIQFTPEFASAVNKLTFNANGGVSPTAEKSVAYGAVYGALPVPTHPDNRIFLGWFTQAEGGDRIKADGNVTTNSDQTIYAHWGGPIVPVERVELNIDKLSMQVGEVVTLIATVYPENATNKNVTWSVTGNYNHDISLDNGVVTALKSGYGINIIVTTEDGNKTATCSVVVSSPSADLHVISASAGQNGKISPSGSVSVRDTYDQTFTITPDEGYMIEDVLFDGVSVKDAIVENGTAYTYTVYNVTGDHTIAVSFKAKGQEPPEPGPEPEPQKKAKAPVSNVESGEAVRYETRILLASSTPEAKIYYTFDGTEPSFDANGDPAGGTNLYRDAIIITGEVTIKAVAVADTYEASEISTFTYTILQDYGEIDEDLRHLFPEATGILDGMWFVFDGEGSALKDYNCSNITEIHKEYTGSNITFNDEIRVYHGTRKLWENRDYTITYSNNKNVASARANKAPTVTIKGKGSYAKSASFTFYIDEVSMDKAVITSEKSVTINAGAMLSTIKPSVTFAGKKLRAGSDFDIEYYEGSEQIVQPSKTGAEANRVYTAKIVAHSGSSFSGTKTETVTITTIQKTDKSVLSMDKVKVTLPKLQWQDGVTYDPAALFEAGSATVTYKGKPLTYGQDYSVTGGNLSDAGSYSVVVTGSNSDAGDMRYVGTKTATLKIEGIASSKVRIACMKTNVEYCGRPIDLDDLNAKDQSGYNAVTLYTIIDRNNVLLEKGKDYDVAYENNTGALGKVAVVFQLKGRYSGSIRKQVTVAAYDLKKDQAQKVTVECSDAEFCKAGAVPEISVKFGGNILRENIDYSLSYKNNKALSGGRSNPTAVIKGIGNFKGSVNAFFEITKADLKNIEAVSADVTASTKKGGFKSVPKLMDAGATVTTGKGKDLETVAKTDYHYYQYDGAKWKEINDDAVISGGTMIEVRVKITASDKSPYKEGTYECVGHYKVLEPGKDISKMMVTLLHPENMIYANGGEIIPLKAEDLKVAPKNGEALGLEDYQIISVTNNRSVGKATVVIKGVGSYGGTKTFTFKIRARDLN